jgi:hypothetical protein
LALVDIELGEAMKECATGLGAACDVDLGVDGGDDRARGPWITRWRGNNLRLGLSRDAQTQREGGDRLTRYQRHRVFHGEFSGVRVIEPVGKSDNKHSPLSIFPRSCGATG